MRNAALLLVVVMHSSFLLAREIVTILYILRFLVAVDNLIAAHVLCAQSIRSLLICDFLAFCDYFERDSIQTVDFHTYKLCDVCRVILAI